MARVKYGRDSRLRVTVFIICSFKFFLEPYFVNFLTSAVASIKLSVALGPAGPHRRNKFTTLKGSLRKVSVGSTTTGLPNCTLEVSITRRIINELRVVSTKSITRTVFVATLDLTRIRVKGKKNTHTHTKRNKNKNTLRIKSKGD